MCGKKYVRTGNRQQYCPDCAKKNRAIKNREYRHNNYLSNKE